jgi:metal-responsive CopG/Arc/MetJ family transcriptional regulator
MVKKVLSVTIDEELFLKWKEFSNENFINSSKLIEKLLREYLKKEKKK